MKDARSIEAGRDALRFRGALKVAYVGMTRIVIYFIFR